jgi:hypothetical protein
MVEGELVNVATLEADYLESGKGATRQQGKKTLVWKHAR